MIPKIVAGGQTSADRAALDFSIKHEIPYGGWVPKGRKRPEDIPGGNGCIGSHIFKTLKKMRRKKYA